GCRRSRDGLRAASFWLYQRPCFRDQSARFPRFSSLFWPVLARLARLSTIPLCLIPQSPAREHSLARASHAKPHCRLALLHAGYAPANGAPTQTPPLII